MNAFNIKKTFEDKAKRGWVTLYVLADLHGTIIKPDHGKIEFYPGAIEVLRWFNSRRDFKVILWTSSFGPEIGDFLNVCKRLGIRIDFVNENPLEANSAKACFDKKPYFNILLDDKAGFEGDTDWYAIKATLDSIGEWSKLDPMNKRAIYVGPEWQHPDNEHCHLTYGLTGFYTPNGTFIPDDNAIPPTRVHPDKIYFPSA